MMRIPFMLNQHLFYILISLQGLFFISCGDNEMNNKPVPKQEIPEALQDNKIDIKSYSRSGDIVEELYQELVSNSSELKGLEDDLEAFKEKPSGIDEKYHAYDSKSTSYYASADKKVLSISDSLLKKKILAFIKKSQTKYTTRTAEHSTLIKLISQNNITISDQHAVLKIIMTAPILEKYQADNLPNKKEFYDIIKIQEAFIERTDSLTPEY